MYTENDEAVISMKKIIYNVKRHFRILIVTMAVAVALVAVSVISSELAPPVYTANSLIQIRAQVIEESDIPVVTAQEIIDEFNIYLLAEGVQDSIRQELDEAGYDDDYSTEDAPVFTVTRNVIAMEVQGTDKERTIFISEMILEELEQYLESYQSDIESTILDSSVEESESSSQVIGRIITGRNIAILLFGIFLGAAIIGLFIFFDNRIYVKEDLVFLNDLKYLYTAKTGQNVSVEMTRRIIEHYKNETSDIALVAPSESSKYELLWEKEHVISVAEPDNLKYIENNDMKIIVLFAVGEEKKRGAQVLMNLMRSLEKQVIGYILVE